MISLILTIEGLHEDFSSTSHSDEGKSEANALSLRVAMLSKFDKTDDFMPLSARNMSPWKVIL